jgi:flagellar protein FliO/FliZ
MSSEYIHVFVSLLGVIAIIFVSVFLVKKFKFHKYAKHKHINIINIVPIGSKEKVILLEVNNTFLLIGATPNHIETLYVFNEMIEKNAANTKLSGEFADKLASMTS